MNNYLTHLLYFNLNIYKLNERKKQFGSKFVFIYIGMSICRCLFKLVIIKT
jgi:hypothetical protein